MIYKRNIFHLACQYGNKELVGFLLELEEMDATEKDTDGNNAEHIACMVENYGIVKFLSDSYKFNFDEKNGQGKTLFDIFSEKEYYNNTEYTTEYIIALLKKEI